MRSAGGIATAAGAVLLALLLGVQVVRNAAVAQFSTDLPQEAARVWPTHPNVELSLSLTEIGSAAAARRPVSDAALAMVADAARKAPLAPEPFLVRGVQAQLRGDLATAEQAFLAAKLRDGRSVPARYFLADLYFRTGRPGPGLREMAMLARRVPQGAASLAPYVAAYARSPGSRSQLRALFRTDRQLADAVLAAMASDPRNSELILSLADPASLRRAERPVWPGILISSLAEAGDFAKARQIWATVSNVGPAAASPVFDPQFKGSDAPPPFNWTLTSSTVGLAERQQGGRLHVIFYGQEDGTLASQLLLLRPGPYRLSMQVSGDLANGRTLSWTVTCAGSANRLATLPLNDRARAAQGVRFSVPGSCAAQRLELAGSAADLPQQVDVTISGLSLVPERRGE